MKLPKAVINSARASALRWLARLGKATGIGLGGSLIVGLALGISQAGCRNDAITYAKAIWPEAKCSAVTTSSGCNAPRYSVDVAVCRVGERRYMCDTELDTPKCKEIFQ